MHPPAILSSSKFKKCCCSEFATQNNHKSKIKNQHKTSLAAKWFMKSDDGVTKNRIFDTIKCPELQTKDSTTQHNFLTLQFTADNRGSTWHKYLKATPALPNGQAQTKIKTILFLAIVGVPPSFASQSQTSVRAAVWSPTNGNTSQEFIICIH